MSSVLFVVPPWAGHVNPTVAVAAELGLRGHDVAWVGQQEIAEMLPRGARVHPSTPISAPRRPPELRGFAALKFLWEEVLVPLAEAMVPAVEEAIARTQPDVLVVDQQALAGALVAERIGIPWVTSATTSAEFTDPLQGMAAVSGWLEQQLASLRARFGNPAATGDLRFSPHLVLAFTTHALVGPASVTGSPLRFVGPALRSVAAGDDFAWERLDAARTLVYVSMGTVNAEASQRFLTECVAAVRARPWAQAVVADPAGALRETGDDQLIVAPHVPQLAVLDRAAVVLCHAGHNTVCEALSAAVPLVVAPIRDDQPIIAEQVVRAGAGVRLRFTRATARHIGEAVDTVLDDPGYRVAARALRDSFAKAGGAVAASDHIERCLTSS